MPPRSLSREAEKTFQKAVIELAHMHRWRVAHFKPAMVPVKGGGKRWVTNVTADGKGFPDLVLVRDGLLIFAELKSETGTETPEQTAWLDELRKVRDPGIILWPPLVEVFVWRPRDWPEIVKRLSCRREAR